MQRSYWLAPVGGRMVADFDRHRPRFFDFVKCVVSRGSGIYSTVNTSLGVLLLAPRASQAWPCERRDQRARAGGRRRPSRRAASRVPAAPAARCPRPPAVTGSTFSHTPTRGVLLLVERSHTHTCTKPTTQQPPPQRPRRGCHTTRYTSKAPRLDLVPDSRYAQQAAKSSLSSGSKHMPSQPG